MGYTHYYTVEGCHSDNWQAAFPKLIEDAWLVVEAGDVLICGPQDGEAEDDNPSPPLIDPTYGIRINGVADDGHEEFVLGRKDGSAFCKTLLKPYDLVVACILLRAYHLAPQNFVLQ
jgi:hypothetical protein